MKISNVNICVDRDKCIACGECVDRCIMDNLRLSVAPCRQACPLAINCQGYLRLMAVGEGEKAAEELRKHTPFAAILGRVCSQPCEERCERNASLGDGAVHIRAVKRYLADSYPAIVSRPTPKAAPSGKKVAIVGSGPAGLMAAHDLVCKGHDVTVFEASSKAGGMLRYGAPSYRLPEKVVDDSVQQLAQLGVRFVMQSRLGKELQLKDLQKQFDAVLVAVGLWDSVRPAIPGADLPGIHDALQVLRAVKEGTFTLQADSVTVLGGGSTAMDVALTLKKLGASQVRVLCLEAEGDMPITEIDRAEAAEEGIILDTRWALESIRNGSGQLMLDVRRCLSVFDKNGKFAPELDQETARSIATGMLVFAIGQKLDTSFGGLPLQARKLLETDPQTGQVNGFDAVFAAGDCSNGASSIVHAMASAHSVAQCIDRFLTQKLPLAIDSWAEAGMVAEYEKVPERSNGAPRGSLERISAAMRNIHTEVEQSFTQEKAMVESRRCLSCGRAYEANKTCWYCLPCEIDCPQKALNVKMPYLVR